MEKRINNAKIKEVAEAYGFAFAEIKAVVLVECAGAGFDPRTGKIQIQFEPNFFKMAKIENGVGVQRVEWEAYNKAFAINPKAAMMATSWGLGQIMGFNFKAAGYKTVEEMVADFKQSEYYQLQGMVHFIKSSKSLANAIKAKDWAGFAKVYNGPAYKRNNYDVKLKQAYEAALRLKV